ncbi:MAG: polysaccharide biosynthesis/export family protein [Saprospiraceae bacterium]|nr:polysaccharide biosynthesis/export family protein [Saprospiraceae bacterium]MDW8228596.1 polysaccharide biosynthesis/export family protein [Saprospiraceae bacterium]
MTSTLFKRSLKPMLLLWLSLTLAYACVARKDLIALQNTPGPQTVEWIEPTVQPGDILHIAVYGPEEPVAPFNHPVAMTPNALTAPQQQTLEIFLGYLVNSRGEIDFPVLGALSVAGLTLPQTKDTLEQRLRQYLREVVVNVRFVNFRITVLGEVNQPGTYAISSPRVTLLEALGRAGDLSPYANRTNILHIREQNGQRIYTRVNLQTSDVFSSPVYYLQQNDIIYVEPNRAKIAAVADPATRIITYTTGVLSVITLLIALFR